ncbi:MAG: NAD-dependent epimerase/dehydratase family protein [Myxococcales bacterium]|nr:NAD-dependent epimerase/dehydratase family protein [Myxococcales bacterium]
MTLSSDAPRIVGITGLGTFLGQRLAARLAARGVRVLGLDVRRPYRLEGQVRFQKLDLLDPTADARLAELLARERVEAVLHAAFRAGPSSDTALDHELETIGSLHVMNACAAAKVRRLVFASSTMLYGPWPDNPNFLTEDHPLRGHPEAHQVADRVEAESLLSAWWRRHPDVEVTVLRPCWVMGPTYLDHVVKYFERPVVATLLGYDPLLQFVHENDCLNAFERAVLEPHPGVYNVVGKGVLPLSTLLALAGKGSLALPTPLLYRMGHYPAKAQTGDAPAGFYDYLRYLWVADGARGWAAFGEPEYTTKEAWISFVSSRRMRRYR